MANARRTRSRVKNPPKPPTKRRTSRASTTKRSHIRRVTLNLIRHAACCPRKLKIALNRLARIDWDMDALSAKDLDTIYAYVDDDLAERAKVEFTADTSSIIDHRFTDWTCSLCGHQGCRWEFTLTNISGGSNVQTGSHCIIEYALSVDGEISAEEALKRLRAAISRMKRVEQREQWQQDHADHVATFERLSELYESIRRPISVRALWSHLKPAWNRRVNGWVKKAKGSIKYYNREGFLTEKRTDELPKLLSDGAAFYSERKAAEDTVESFTFYWDTLISAWARDASEYEIDSLRYARRWKMDPDRPSWRVADTVRVLENRTGHNPARDEDGNAILSADKPAKRKTTSAAPSGKRSARRKARRSTAKSKPAAKRAKKSTAPVNDDHLF